MRIRQFRWAIPLTFVAIAGCSGMSSQPQQSAAPAADPAVAIAAADSLNKVYLAAFAARDTNAAAGLYADDGYLLAQGMPMMTGLSEIRNGWAGFMSTPGLDLKFQSTRKIVSEAGDMVIDVGTYQQKMTDAKGKPVEDVGKYVTVFKKTNKGWKILVDTFNSDKGPM